MIFFYIQCDIRSRAVPLSNQNVRSDPQIHKVKDTLIFLGFSPKKVYFEALNQLDLLYDLVLNHKDR